MNSETPRPDELTAADDAFARRVSPRRSERLEIGCKLLNAAEERALAEEGLEVDAETWPEY